MKIEVPYHVTIIAPSNGMVQGVVQLPISKSESNRVQIVNALNGFSTAPENISEAHDSQIIHHILNGHQTEWNIEDSGAAARFLIAYACAKHKQVICSGTGRMHERPMQPLLMALEKLGAQFKFLNKKYALPLIVTGTEMHGGELEIDASISSQFISALMMIAPTLAGGLRLKFKGEIASWPYIKMTAQILKSCNAEVHLSDDEIIIPQQKLHQANYKCHGDWSAAAFFFGLAAISNSSEILFQHLKINSHQGDEIILQWMIESGMAVEETSAGLLLRKLGAVPLKPHYDFSNYPDIAQLMMVINAATPQRSVFTGLHSLPLKESNRIFSMNEELKKLNMELIQRDQEFRVSGTLQTGDVSFNSHMDHRLAMSLSLLSLKCNSVTIKNAEVVNKSFPQFFKQLKNLGFRVEFDYRKL